MMVADRIRDLRQELGLTQTEFAEKANVRQPMIAAIEKGEKSPSIETVQRICKEFKLPKDYFSVAKQFNEKETAAFVKQFATLPRAEQDILQIILQKFVLIRRLTSKSKSD